MNAQLPVTDANVAQLPAVRKPTEVRVVEDVIHVLDTARFEHMQRIAMAMARMSLIPETLRGENEIVTAANCFMVVNQAVSWNMDPFAVAQCVSVINGRLMHEGKLIAAVIEQKLGIKLHKEWRGLGEQMSIAVSNPRDPTECVSGTVAEWKTTRSGSPWVPKQYAKMLWYRGAREWCRMYAPGLILGIYSPDEEWDDVAPAAAIDPPTPPEPPAIEARAETTSSHSSTDEQRISNSKGAGSNPAESANTQMGSSSTVEHRAVNAGVAGSSPASSANPEPPNPPGTDALGGKPGADAIPPGLRRAGTKKADAKLSTFDVDKWLVTLENECKDKTPAQLLDLQVKMVEPLRERLGHDGYCRAGDIMGRYCEEAQKKYAVTPPAPAFDADAWYNDLSGAVSGCTSIEQVMDVQNKVQKPAQSKVSAENYAKGKKLVAAALMQLASED
jgi:hypothetical protein